MSTPLPSKGTGGHRPHVCILYDCLFPATVGGAERWYRSLAEAYAAAGWTVTYVTLRQWDRGKVPVIPGVEVVTAGPRLALYQGGKRRILPPLVFGIGVFAHLLRRGSRYDLVHTCSFPYFSVLAAAAVRPLVRYRMIVDWFEVWTKEYWQGYLGRLGQVGWQVQALCARVPQISFSFSTLQAKRIEQLAGRPVTVLQGVNAEKVPERDLPAATPPRIVCAGRMIPEKNVPLLVDALALVMADDPSLRATLIGRGPELERVTAIVAAHGLQDRISLPGFVTDEALDAALSSATVIVQPSLREGFGLVVIEASARGVPVVVIDAPDNASRELVENGSNGIVASSSDSREVAAAISAAVAGGRALRESTRRWYAANAERFSFERSFAKILEQVAS
jgi:glycosyltransferase involved in cell wall biosynthesis